MLLQLLYCRKFLEELLAQKANAVQNLHPFILAYWDYNSDIA